MARLLLHLLTIFALVYVSNASLPAKCYWNSVFPDTPIPKTLQNLLQPGVSNKDIFMNMVENVRNHVEQSPASFLYASQIGYLTAYFLQNDLHLGNHMNIPQIPEKQDKSTFLPRGIADSMPFSTAKLPEILKQFSMEPSSLESEIIQVAIKDCDAASIEGEDKFCATSLESMIDLVFLKLGKRIRALATEFEKETETHDFTIGEGMLKIGDKQVICHKEKYPYAVFMCHSIEETDAYVVPLVGADGVAKAKAVAICHRDTSGWNPNHVAFKQLNVEPGTVPICHFLTRNTLVWAPNRFSQ